MVKHDLAFEMLKDQAMFAMLTVDLVEKPDVVESSKWFLPWSWFLYY